MAGGVPNTMMALVKKIRWVGGRRKDDVEGRRDSLKQIMGEDGKTRPQDQQKGGSWRKEDGKGKQAGRRRGTESEGTGTLRYSEVRGARASGRP